MAYQYIDLSQIIVALIIEINSREKQNLKLLPQYAMYIVVAC
jgi:hypothetical protein